MIEYVFLTEHESRSVDLSPEHVSLLQKRLAGKLDILPGDGPGQYSMRPGSFAGIVALPGGRTLVIQPKASIDTLFAMLAEVYDPQRDVFGQEPQTYSTVSELFEFVVKLFAFRAHDLVSRGLLRGYRPVTDDPMAIRGRILFSETLRRRPVLRDRHWCGYTQFTADVPENRIIRWTAYSLRCNSYRAIGLSAELNRIVAILSSANLDADALRLFEELTYHRLNDAYRPVLTLARLLLEHLTFSGAVGDEPFLVYLIDMNQLFESYVTSVLQRGLQSDTTEVAKQDPHDLDESRLVHMRPDIVIRREGVPVLVIDAKYKLDPAQSDLYQALAYCHGLEVGAAVLVHPLSEAIPTSFVRVRGPGGFEIHYLPMSLGGNPKELRSHGDLLVRRVAAMLSPREASATTQPLEALRVSIEGGR